jgi:lipid-binding SYLF domain-containing protein
MDLKTGGNIMKLRTPLSLLCAFVVCTALIGSPQAFAKSSFQIDAGVKETLDLFHDKVAGAKGMIKRADGMLVFPSVIKAGLGIGGEYGEGALMINGKTVDYYSTAAGSIGFQLGAQKKSIVILFNDKLALKSFRRSKGWKAGVDASIAVIKLGAGGYIDTEKLNEPIVGFVFGQKGLMYNLTLEGSKFTKLNR